MITMSDSTFGYYGTSGPMPQQLEFKGCVWESAKGPSATSRAWLCIFGGIVSNYNVGPQLERFLIPYLKRDPQAELYYVALVSG